MDTGMGPGAPPRGGKPLAARRPLRLLIVDDHRLFAEGLAVLLERDEDVHLVGVAESVEQAKTLLAAQRPDVALVDVDLAGQDGLQLTEWIKHRCPEVRVVIVSALPEKAILSRGIQAGASGFLSKSRAADELLLAVKHVAAGGVVITMRELPADVQRRRDRIVWEDGHEFVVHLTPRQLEILQALADGKSTKEIAHLLFVSELTVRTHVKSILAKLGAHSRLQAVNQGIRHGLIQRPRAARSEGTGRDTPFGDCSRPLFRRPSRRLERGQGLGYRTRRLSSPGPSRPKRPACAALG
jgi:DNA-binding NarL/FixJ family response regulator